MHTDLSPVDLVQAVVGGGTQSLCFIDPEFLRKGEIVDVLSASFQSFSNFLYGQNM